MLTIVNLNLVSLYNITDYNTLVAMTTITNQYSFISDSVTSFYKIS